VLVPQGNAIHEREFARLCPQSVSFSFRGFSYPPAGEPGFCEDLISQMQAPIRELTSWGAEAILIGCTTASMRCSAVAYQARLEEIAGVAVITAASASRAAAAALGLKSVAVATPYGENGNCVVRDYLTSQGLTVSAIEGLSLDRTPETWSAGVAALTPERLLALAMQIDSVSSQGLYLPCTGIASLDAITMYEARSGKPAFSSVQAGFWACLTQLGRLGRQSGSGRLLATWSF
jgi:arylmalonate decarboxylase